MKKTLSIICAFFFFIITFSFLGCEKEKTMVAEKEELKPYMEYNRESYLKPFWHTREVYQETVLFVGESDSAPLMYEPSEIISVRDYSLKKEFQEGKDYIIENGMIVRLDTSAIPYIPLEEYYRTTPDTVEIQVTKDLQDLDLEGNRYLMFGEGTTFTEYQIAVTYRHNQAWEGSKVIGYADKFQSSIKKIKSGSAKVLFFGDSITQGCNASGTAYGGNVSPFCESWPVMVTEFLKSKYNVPIEYINKGIGGTTTQQGVDRFEADVLSYNPDLLVIAYGMNDPQTTPENYKKMIEFMVVNYNENVPGGDIILVSPMLPNVETNWCKNQPEFESVLNEIAQKYDNCALAPVTSLHKDLLNTGKRYRDMTGNNVNHPNDFIVRLYAQVVLKTYLGDLFFEDKYVAV